MLPIYRTPPRGHREFRELIGRPVAHVASPVVLVEACSEPCGERCPAIVAVEKPRGEHCGERPTGAGRSMRAASVLRYAPVNRTGNSERPGKRALIQRHGQALNLHSHRRQRVNGFAGRVRCVARGGGALIAAGDVCLLSRLDAP
jgi:hypothetical protein